MLDDASAARMNHISRLRLTEHVEILRATNGAMPHIDPEVAVIEAHGDSCVIVAFDAANDGAAYTSCSLSSMAFHPDAVERTMAYVLDRLAHAACAPFN